MACIHVFGALSHARGYVFSECRRQAIYLVVMGVAVWLLLPYGIKGVALAVVLATLARYLLLAHLSLKLVGVSWEQFFPPVQVICTFLNALVCWVLQYATTPRMSLKDRVHAQL